MSMEIYVLSKRCLTSMEQWQHSIDAAGVSLRLSTLTPLAQLRGALPVVIDLKRSHFECDHWDADDVSRAYPGAAFDRGSKYALAMRWGGDVDAGFSAYVAAAAYAKATNGVIFDCQEGKIISAQRAIEIANELKTSAAAVKSAVQRVVKRFK
ncbi:MAG TPA: hypothetical protein VIQ05_07620 [Tardiphaga sp.]